MPPLLQFLSEEIRYADKERAAVSLETGFELASERAIAIVIDVIVVTNVKGGAGIWVPSEQKLPSGVGLQGVVIQSCPNKREPGELIGGTQGIDVYVVGCLMRIVTGKLVSVVVERDPQSIDRFVSKSALDEEVQAFAGVQWRRRSEGV